MTRLRVKAFRPMEGGKHGHGEAVIRRLSPFDPKRKGPKIDASELARRRLTGIIMRRKRS